MGAWLLEVTRLLLLGQMAQATVTGVIRDLESGEPLASAVVALTDVERTVISDVQGRYSFNAVPAGPHHVTVRRIGYSPRALHALVPTRGELQINITLAAVPVRLRGVEIRPAVAIRGTDHDDHATPAWRGISAAALRNHPMLAEPDAFLALGGGGVVMRSETPTGIHLRGGASDQTAFVLDGIPIFSPYHVGGTFSARDKVYLAGSLIEETLDWYAQDGAGNVWYLGEDSKEIENGQVVSTEGSWEWGKEGALPGIIMWADPGAHIGENYRQEFFRGEAEDWAKVLAVGQTVNVPYGNLTGCIKTEDWNGLESGGRENKYYCPGVGLALEVKVEGGERLQLLSKTP